MGHLQGVQCPSKTSEWDHFGKRVFADVIRIFFFSVLGMEPGAWHVLGKCSLSVSLSCVPSPKSRILR